MQDEARWKPSVTDAVSGRQLEHIQRLQTSRVLRNESSAIHAQDEALLDALVAAKGPEPTRGPERCGTVPRGISSLLAAQKQEVKQRKNEARKRKKDDARAARKKEKLVANSEHASVGTTEPIHIESPEGCDGSVHAMQIEEATKQEAVIASAGHCCPGASGFLFPLINSSDAHMDPQRLCSTYVHSAIARAVSSRAAACAVELME